MKVTVAPCAGFCFGVTRALDIAFDAAREGRGPVATLGPIIHNPQVVAKLEGEGLHAFDELDRIESGTLVVRSHGLPKSVLDRARAKGLTVVDATCPFVKQAQERAVQLEREGYRVVVVGEKDHPEVLSITGNLEGPAIVVNDTGSLSELGRHEKIGVVCQTTQPLERLRSAVNELLERTTELKVFNTICGATLERQRNALDLARRADVMVVVGGKNSANTRRLRELCREAGCDAYHIETADELEPQWFEGRNEVGVTGGASTPQWIIDEIVGVIEAMG